MQFPMGVHFFQPQQVVFVEATLLKSFRFVDIAILVKSEPFGFSRLDHRVFQEFDHHEVLQLHQILLVGGFWRSLLVDVGQEYTRAAIFIQIGWVMPVLSLDQLVLSAGTDNLFHKPGIWTK